MKGIAFGLAGAAVVLAALTAPPLRAADDAATLIETRQELMKEQGRHMKAINAVLENGGDLSDIVAHAEALATLGPRIPTLFPAGTSLGDGVGRTGAKPAIWEDWAGFEAAVQRLTEESAKLAELAAAGDQAAAAAQFATLGKRGCGGCHTPFRQKLD